MTLDPAKAPIPQYRSKAPYSVQPEESNAILEASAYHRRDFDLAVTWFPASTHTPVVTSVLSAFHEPTTALGELDRLPLELISQICLQLDIASIFRFRQINARARQILNALHEYRMVATHALNPLCALLRTRSAPRVTLRNCYRLLCTQTCSVCGKRYGDLVYLPTWIRCCTFCRWESSPEIHTTTVACAKRVLRLSKGSLDKLPKLTTIWAMDIMDEFPGPRPMTIVPIRSALSAYCHENPEVLPTQDMLDELDLPIPFTPFACCALPSYNPQTGQIENGVSCAGCQVAFQDKTNRQRAWLDFRDRVYSREGFLEHFAWCAPAQDLWLASNRGTTRSPKYPFMCRNGGFFSSRE